MLVIIDYFDTILLYSSFGAVVECGLPRVTWDDFTSDKSNVVRSPVQMSYLYLINGGQLCQNNQASLGNGELHVGHIWL